MLFRSQGKWYVEFAQGLDQEQVGYRVKEPSDVICQHCCHFFVVPSCFDIVHHGEEGVLGRFARDTSEVGRGDEVVLSCYVRQTSRLYSFKCFAYYL